MSLANIGRVSLSITLDEIKKSSVQRDEAGYPTGEGSIPEDIHQALRNIIQQKVKELLVI
ncbi:hypothetical protein PMSD_00370 [Paenibacillus macquariensis subsp. defensor]|nr:hypothetical protein PMSD_00370 [Paenibacillus macquariensis subsp. defensor]